MSENWEETSLLRCFHDEEIIKTAMCPWKSLLFIKPEVSLKKNEDLDDSKPVVKKNILLEFF